VIDSPVIVIGVIQTQVFSILHQLSVLIRQQHIHYTCIYTTYTYTLLDTMRRGSLGQGDLTGVIRSTFDRYFEPRGVLQVCPDRNTRDSSSYQCVGLNSNYMVNPTTLEGDGNYYGSMCNVGYKATSNDCSSVSNTVSYHHHMTIVSYRFLYS